jgi:hypothetical protein
MTFPSTQKTGEIRSRFSRNDFQLYLLPSTEQKGKKIGYRNTSYGYLVSYIFHEALLL